MNIKDIGNKMNKIIFRSYKEPIRENITWNERWKGSDKGLIMCWEVGRNLQQKRPELAELALNNELPVLGWKGGVNKKLTKEKYGSLNYLAQWQALRGEDLNIDISKEYVLVCSKTQMQVTFTNDTQKILE